MRTISRRGVSLLACGAALVGCTLSSGRVGAAAPPAAVVTVRTTKMPTQLPAGFAGLALESFDVNSPLLDPTRTKIATILSHLGRSRLRIGGTESGIYWQGDPSTPPPAWAKLVVTDASFVRLARFTRHTRWRVDLGVGLAHADPPNAAAEVADARRRLGTALASVEIGNEPDIFAAKGTRPSGYGYGAYKKEIDMYRGAIKTRAPKVPVAGPDLARSPAVTTWLRQYLADEHTGLAFAAQHHYATSACNGNTPTITDLLSASTRSNSLAVINALVSAARGAGVPARLDETNSTSCGGQPGVSDRFASALWAVRYLLDAAQRGVAGVNVNGFLEACLGYTPLCADKTGQLHAQPVFYGLLFVHAAGTGRFLQVAASSDPATSVYAVEHANGSVAVVLVNCDPRRTMRFAVQVASTRTARLLRLTAPNVASASHVTLGGATVMPDGTFSPTTVAVEHTSAGYPVTLAPGSAAVLTVP